MIPFNAFIQSIQEAVTDSNNKIQVIEQDRFMQYFSNTTSGNNNTDPVLEARSVKIQLPVRSNQGTSGMKLIDVPVASLIPHTFSKIDKVHLTTKVRVAVLDSQLYVMNNLPPAKGGWFKRILSLILRRKKEPVDYALIDMTFCAHHTNEDINGIIQRYEQTIMNQIK